MLLQEWQQNTRNSIKGTFATCSDVKPGSRLGSRSHEPVPGLGINVGEALRRSEVPRFRAEVLERDRPAECLWLGKRQSGAFGHTLEVLLELVEGQL